MLHQGDMVEMGLSAVSESFSHGRQGFLVVAQRRKTPFRFPHYNVGHLVILSGLNGLEGYYSNCMSHLGGDVATFIPGQYTCS